MVSRNPSKFFIAGKFHTAVQSIINVTRVLWFNCIQTPKARMHAFSAFWFTTSHCLEQLVIVYRCVAQCVSMVLFLYIFNLSHNPKEISIKSILTQNKLRNKSILDSRILREDWFIKKYLPCVCVGGGGGGQRKNRGTWKIEKNKKAGARLTHDPSPDASLIPEMFARTL